MERDAYVRAARRRQVEEALVFERGREAELVTELEDLLAQVDGPALDDALLGRLEPDEAVAVRSALALDDVDPFDPGDPEEEPDPLAAIFEGRVFDDEDAGEAWDEDEPDDPEQELERLREEIEDSRRIQAALERYAVLLDEPPPEGPEGEEKRRNPGGEVTA